MISFVTRCGVSLRFHRALAGRPGAQTKWRTELKSLFVVCVLGVRRRGGGEDT